MIFEELIIHNFGIYKGRHSIPLSPKSYKKPIILLGGLNGGGKTTFLDALQLTLYGKFSQCSNRGNIGYHDFLKETINRHSSPQEGAALELKFSTHIDGELNTYHVKRFWRQTGKATIREEMEVIHNDVFDLVMTEQWYEYVNEFIPLNISSLFFFDGEKIEALADPEGSAKLLQTGISSLLGLDIVDKLGVDLDALIRTDIKSSERTEKKANDPKAQLQESKLTELLNRKEGLNQNLASVASRLDNLNREIEHLSEKYRKSGGALFDEREQFDNKLESINTTINKNERELANLAEGVFPLHMVEDLLWQSQEQAIKEENGSKTQLLLSELQKQNKNLIEFLRSQKADQKTTKLVKEKLHSDINDLKRSIPNNSYLHTPADAFHGLSQDFFHSLKQTASTICKDISELKETRLHVERKLSAVPEEETLIECQHQLTGCKKYLLQEQAKHEILKEQIVIAQHQIEQAELRLTNIKLEQNKDSFEAELQNRILDNINNAKSILNSFNLTMIEKHIKHLESLILESFIALIRKKDLVSKITISPNTYQIQLLDEKLNLIPTNRLSAGERQILAISILWGLAKASGRPLPLIIDTPLGRLDSKHRKQLIDNYFPKASHQVILLSTDQEIDRSYRDDLHKYIGREYHIQYDETLQSSTISEGYF